MDVPNFAFRTWIGLALLVAAPCAFGQAALAGAGQYPEARSLSGLSGGASALLPNGVPSIRGAMSLSTPIGYTLGNNRAILVGANTSANGSPRWFDGDVAENGSNGTAAMLFGMGLDGGNFAVSLVQTSRLSDDRIINLQVSPSRAYGRLGLSFGVQDLLDQTKTTPTYSDSTDSYFAAATYELGGGNYLSVGGGTERFKNGFSNMSVQLYSGAKGMIEYDGFGWNYGAGFTLDSISVANSSKVPATLFIGTCQGRYMTWSLSFQF